MDTALVIILAEIASDIEGIETDAALFEETNFNSRADAIDFIDFHIIDRTEGLIQTEEQTKKLDILKQRAEKVKCDLEKIDADLFINLREKISSSICDNRSFKKMVYEYIGDNVNNHWQPGKIGYDNLDVFIDGLLHAQKVPSPSKEPKPGMIFYQKTPVRIIFELVELAHITPDDVFFDLGSGWGQVSILVNLLSGATARGIEYEPAYCNYARSCAEKLKLRNVEFINEDAREGNYADGTLFFMYSPFEGAMLLQMLKVLQNESLKRTIRVFTYGPCSAQVARQNWLNCLTGDPDDPYSLCEFSSL